MRMQAAHLGAVTCREGFGEGVETQAFTRNHMISGRELLPVKGVKGFSRVGGDVTVAGPRAKKRSGRRR